MHAHATDLAKRSWALLIADEAHMGRGRKAQRTAALIGKVSVTPEKRLVKKPGLASLCARCWMATATLVADRARDVFAPLKLIAPEAFPYYWPFAKRYAAAVPNIHGGWDDKRDDEVPAEVKAELKERIAYWCHVVTKDAIQAHLPAKRREVVYVEYDGSPLEPVRDVSTLERALADAAEVKSRLLVEDAATALESGSKVILVGARRQWVPKMFARISRAIGDIAKQCWLRWTHGEESLSSRQAMADEYMAWTGPALLVATYKSVGTSINLHDTDELMWGALPVTGEDAGQMEGRVQRVGGPRPRPVRVRYYVADGTVDEVLERAFLGKLATGTELGVDTESSVEGMSDNWGPSRDEIVRRCADYIAEAEGMAEKIRRGPPTNMSRDAGYDTF